MTEKNLVIGNVVDESLVVENSVVECSQSDENVDLDDVELLKVCSRQDLFDLIKGDPEHYLGLIKENKLGDQLMIMTSRSADGGSLRIKFRIYPEDRWTEVGYFGDCSDAEVLDDFKTQIESLMTRTRRGKEESRTSHLQSQLDANNDMTSSNYGVDLPLDKLRQLRSMTPFEKQLSSAIKKDGSSGSSGPVGSSGSSGSGESDSGQKLPSRRHARKKPELPDSPIESSMSNSLGVVGGEFGDESANRSSESRRENLKNQIQSVGVTENLSPVSYLTQFTAGLIDHLLRELPSLIKWDAEAVSNLPDVFASLTAMDVPKSFEMAHQQLVDRLSEHLYLAKLCEIGLDKVAGLNSELAEFHEVGLKINPHFYLELDWTKVETSVLEHDDLMILKKYGLNIRQIWRDYLTSSK